jgi:hypothetical protein
MGVWPLGPRAYVHAPPEKGSQRAFSESRQSRKQDLQAERYERFFLRVDYSDEGEETKGRGKAVIRRFRILPSLNRIIYLGPEAQIFAPEL